MVVAERGAIAKRKGLLSAEVYFLPRGYFYGLSSHESGLGFTNMEKIGSAPLHIIAKIAFVG